MYPLNVFSLFPPFPREKTVFVAMSFDPRFQERWSEVIVPAIGRLELGGAQFKPIRVDARTISECILTEILTGISNSTLFLADITSIGQLDGRPVRNGNVMYEVGLAHAVRLPEEVILFRSDDDDLLFDVGNVRVNRYRPDEDAASARRDVGEAIVSALKEVDLKQHLAVQHALGSLDLNSWNTLVTTMSVDDGTVAHPVIRTMGDVMAKTPVLHSITRLLDLGILRADYVEVTPEVLTKMKDAQVEEWVTYKLTPFGRATMQALLSRTGMLSPEMQKLAAELCSQEQNGQGGESHHSGPGGQ